MQMARIIGAAADLSERTSDVAVSALNVTSQLASEATHFVLQAAANGLSTGANLWKGVDLQDIQAHRCNGQVLVDGPESLEQWLQLEPGIGAHPMSDRSPSATIGGGESDLGAGNAYDSDDH